jgi:hypothetical protein
MTQPLVSISRRHVNVEIACRQTEITVDEMRPEKEILVAHDSTNESYP